MRIMRGTALFPAAVMLAACAAPAPPVTLSPEPTPELTWATPFPDDFWDALPNGQTLKRFIDEDSGDCEALAEYYDAWEPSNVNPAAKILLLDYLEDAWAAADCDA